MYPLRLLLAVAVAVAVAASNPAHAQGGTPAKGGVFVAPTGLLADPGSDLAGVVGPFAVELSFALGTSATLNLLGGGSFGEVNSAKASVYIAGLGFQYFPGARTYEGLYIYPSFYGGAASASTGGESPVESEATVLGLLGSIGHQWNWNPFSLRLGGGLGYESFSAEASTSDSDDEPVSATVSGSGMFLRLDFSLGLTWGGSDTPPPEAKRADRSKRRIESFRPVPRKVVKLMALQQDDTVQVKIEHTSPSGRLSITATHVGDRIVMRGCDGMELRLDDSRKVIWTTNETRSVKGKIVETRTGQFDEGLAAKVVASTDGRLDVCGVIIPFTDDFKTTLAKSLPGNRRGGGARPAASKPAKAGFKAGTADGTLKFKLSLDGLDLFLQATPGESADEVLLGLRVPTDGPDIGEPCTVNLLVNGAPLSVTAYTVEKTDKATLYRTTTTLAEIERIAKAERVAGKICGLRFVLDEAGLKSTRDFTIRFKEEASFATPTP